MASSLRHRTARVLLLPLLILALVLLWNWNWFKPLVERQASAAVGRGVTIENLDVQLSRTPQITLDGIQVANPEGMAGLPPLAELQRLAVRLSLRALFDRQLHILSLQLQQPVLALQREAKGAGNWALEPSASEPDRQPWVVRVDSLEIDEGRFSLRDAQQKADLRGTVRTALVEGTSTPSVLATTEGRYAAEAFAAKLIAGSVLTLRTPENPYPVDLQLSSGATRLSLQGTLLDPLQFAGAKLKLQLQGNDLAALSGPTGFPLPATPPYRLEGDFDYRAGRIQLHRFKGLVGESDIAGDISVALRAPRPLLTATVRSEQLRLADLSGLIGADPGPQPAAEASRERLLPSTPINVPRLQNADVKFDFVGARLVGERLPFDRLSFALTLDDGVLRATPVDFGIGAGTLRLYATLDPRGETLGLEASAELRRVDISRLMEKTGYRGEGRIGGVARLKGKGRSAAELLGGGDGELKLAMAGGNFSALLLDLSGLDFGNALLSALGIGKRTEVRCLVGDFALTKGQLDTRSFVLDTGNTNLLLDGGANLADETLALRLRTEPKRANIGRLKAPIYIGGRFTDPSIRPDYVDLGLRGGAAVALGVLLTPLAAILPTLQLGPGEDRDCQALLASAEISAPPQPAAR